MVGASLVGGACESPLHKSAPQGRAGSGAGQGAERQAVAKEFGATDIVEERGDQAIEAVMRLTDGRSAWLLGR